jgi:hypothetical protein
MGARRSAGVGMPGLGARPRLVVYGRRAPWSGTFTGFPPARNSGDCSALSHALRHEVALSEWVRRGRSLMAATLPRASA